MLLAIHSSWPNMIFTLVKQISSQQIVTWKVRSFISFAHLLKKVIIKSLITSFTRIQYAETHHQFTKGMKEFPCLLILHLILYLFSFFNFIKSFFSNCLFREIMCYCMNLKIVYDWFNRVGMRERFSLHEGQQRDSCCLPV